MVHIKRKSRQMPEKGEEPQGFAQEFGS